MAANVSDGMINVGSSDYMWNTDLASGNDKWETDGHNNDQEYDDGSGGDKWDINFLGTDIDRSGSSSQFQFGAVGGSILTRENMQGSRRLYLSDIAINVVGDDSIESTNPTESSAGWDYAIRLLGVNATAGTAEFQLLEFVRGSSWLETDIYGYRNDGDTSGHHGGHYSDTYRMDGGNVVEVDGQQSFFGEYSEDTDSSDGDDDYVLEGSFDLDLLSLFDEASGGRIITYLTMSCVNDEAIVEAHVSPVPLPSAVWLFGSALFGFISMSRRTKV